MRVAVCPLLAYTAVSTVSGIVNAKPWIEGRAGVGLTSGHYEFEKEYAGALTMQPGVAHDEGGPFGIAIALGVAGGYAVNEQVALGLSGRIELAPYLENINPRYASLDLHTLAAVGSTFAFRPAPSFELRVTPEWAFASFAGSSLDIGAEDNVFEFENLSGPGLGFSLGYCSAPGFGVSGSTNVVLLSSEHQMLSLLTFTVLASWSNW
jgi:hypothetical protein